MYLTFSTNALNEGKMHLDLKFFKKWWDPVFMYYSSLIHDSHRFAKLVFFSKALGSFICLLKFDLDLKLLMQLKMYASTYHIIFQPIFLSKEKIIITNNMTETSSGSYSSQYDILNEEYSPCDLLFEHLVSS